MNRPADVSRRTTSPLSTAGIQQERYQQSVDLVTPAEAVGRLGEGAEVNLVARYRRRRSSVLAAGTDAWLIDLTTLSRPLDDPRASIVAACSLEVLERGNGF